MIAGGIQVVLPVVVRVPVVGDRDDALGQSPHPQRIVLGLVPFDTVTMRFEGLSPMPPNS